MSQYRTYRKKTRPAPWQLAQELAGHGQGKAATQTPASGQPVSRAKGYRGLPRISKRRQERGLWAKYPEFARGVVRKARAGGRRCPVVLAIKELREGMAYGHPISSKITQCHHIFGHGTNEELLLWESGCMGVSMAGHRWIHSNQEEARKRHWLAPKGLFDNARKVLGIWNLVKTNEKFRERMIALAT